MKKNGINLIAKHLYVSNLKLNIYKGEFICSFTGRKIKEAVKNKDLIKKTFTDHSYIRYNSEYSSLDAALCISAVVPSKKGFNSLRNYSYLVTEKELVFLSRDKMIDIVTNPPVIPFLICITYSNKKHTSYKAKINSNSEVFEVTTDLGNVIVDQQKVKHILPVIQNWYTIIKGKEDTAAQQTNFTKKDILNGCDNPNKIRNYGIEKYFAENSIIEKHRNTAFLNLLVHILNKKIC